MVDDGQYSGLAIELGKDNRKDLNLQSNYRFLSNIPGACPMPQPSE